MAFPIQRPRRLRRSEAIRSMVRENHLRVTDLVYPVFVCPGEGVKKEIASLPGNYQMSVDVLVEEMKEVRDLGIPAVILFGIPSRKDEEGSEAYDPGGIIQKALEGLKEKVPELLLITDVCLCEYTSHGHCGLIHEGDVDNDKTLELLARTAVSHARAGADIVAPSDMMDGRVAAIRSALDREGFEGILVMSYSVKYASAFYGPFREAAGSAPQFGDRRGYQMDPPNSREALREARLDLEEGADILMVKPALSYLDVISLLRRSFDVPVATYNVSGEYAMFKAAAAKGWIDEKRVVMEAVTSMKRAGADIILTYYAKDLARWLDE